MFVAFSLVGFFVFNQKNNSADFAIAEMRNDQKDFVYAQKALSEIRLTAEAAYVEDVNSGTILLAKNSDQPMPLASLTKLMTALVAYKNIKNSNFPIVFSPRNSMVADVFTAKDALSALLVDSSNESATSLANLEGDNFVKEMNNMATVLGLKSMKFYNPTGLDISENQAGAYGSAKDVSDLIKHIVSYYPELVENTRDSNVTVNSVETGIAYNLQNTNLIIGDIPGVLASKTGYTDLAGGNLAVMFDIGVNHPIVAVVLGSTFEDRFKDMVKIASTTMNALAEMSQK